MNHQPTDTNPSSFSAWPNVIETPHLRSKARKRRRLFKTTLPIMWNHTFIEVRESRVSPWNDASFGRWVFCHALQASGTIVGGSLTPLWAERSFMMGQVPNTEVAFYYTACSQIVGCIVAPWRTFATWYCSIWNALVHLKGQAILILLDTEYDAKNYTSSLYG